MEGHTCVNPEVERIVRENEGGEMCARALAEHRSTGALEASPAPGARVDKVSRSAVALMPHRRSGANESQPL